MRELARVLKPNGWAVLMVPLNPEIKTFEDPSITDPADRVKFFLQEDHVRLYGNDFPIRLNECGLDVRTVRKADFLTRREIARFDINDFSGALYLCSKTQDPGAQH